jgi:hypothetical protein
MGAGALPPGSVYAVFPRDKEFRAFEMLEKNEFSLKWLEGLRDVCV